MTDLAQFLRARYTEQRALAEQASPGPWRVNPDDPDDVLAADGVVAAEVFALSGNQLRSTALFIAAHDPAYALADLDAKRRILNEIVPAMDGMDDRIDSEWGVGAMDPSEYESVGLLRLLALPYTDHPEYRPEWAP